MPELTAAQQHRAALEARGDERVCIASHFHPSPCEGPLSADHLVAVKWLTQTHKAAVIAFAHRHRPSPLLDVSLDDLIADGRNGAWICRGHNALRESSGFRIPARYVPMELYAFFADYPELGERYLDRIIGS